MKIKESVVDHFNSNLQNIQQDI